MSLFDRQVPVSVCRPSVHIFNLLWWASREVVYQNTINELNFTNFRGDVRDKSSLYFKIFGLVK